MSGPPARAMRGHKELRREISERVARRSDNRFERPTAEVEAAQDDVDSILARELSNIAQDVDEGEEDPQAGSATKAAMAKGGRKSRPASQPKRRARK